MGTHESWVNHRWKAMACGEHINVLEQCKHEQAGNGQSRRHI